ncbi:MAG TPA: hypothetical protein VD994_18080 [Prosthecobacter sp.]|nr:hypothetical protein [Prosthecobacter sp.]
MNSPILLAAASVSCRERPRRRHSKRRPLIALLTLLIFASSLFVALLSGAVVGGLAAAITRECLGNGGPHPLPVASQNRETALTQPAPSLPQEAPSQFDPGSNEGVAFSRAWRKVSHPRKAMADEDEARQAPPSA